jgi:hypothetical protein
MNRVQASFHPFARRLTTLLGAAALLALSAGHVAAQQTLTNNVGADSDSWFISGEPSLVMNGFDLNALAVPLPTTVTSASIVVDTPVPGTPVEVVVYGDANGGSPSDAVLLGRTTVDITGSGQFTAVFPTPIAVAQPAIWVGFYLPVNFRFLADTSGTSTLTYWAWTPGGTFDLAQLSSAAVLGPSNGTAPVNINLNGRARINVTLGTGTPTTPGVVGTPNAPGTGDLGVMAAYPNCANVLYDTADERVTWREAIDAFCNLVPEWQAPPSPLGYIRQGSLYDIFFFKENGTLVNDRLTFPVTHCIRPESAFLDTGAIGVAYGAPRVWRILPTQRFGDLICAEVRFGGNLAFFTRTQ